MKDKIIQQREQLQEDLRCILDGVDDSFLDNVCQVVVDRMNILVAEVDAKADFTAEEQTVVLELARLALADAETYDDVANKLDLSDEFLKPLQEKMTVATNE